MYFAFTVFKIFFHFDHSTTFITGNEQFSFIKKESIILTDNDVYSFQFTEGKKKVCQK